MIVTPTLVDFLGLVSARRGHFRLESGHHGALWLDLDALFARPGAIAPFVDGLAERLGAHTPEMVCGPLLGGGFLAQWLARDLGVEFCFTERQTGARPDGLYGATYCLPPAFRSRVRGRRVAMVDDVVSAGSALRATSAELEIHGAVPVTAGTLLVLGDAAKVYFSARGLAIEGVVRDDYPLWAPGECPLCSNGVPLEDVAT